MKKVEVQYKIYDNKIEIIPEGGILDNSIYEITIRGLKSEDRTRFADEVKTSVTTRLYPAYASLDSVKSLTDVYAIPDEKILYFIREASLFAEYVKQETYSEDNVPFEVRQYVKYRAAYDSLMRFYMDVTTKSGQKGTLGEITFENGLDNASIKDLLKEAKSEVDKWTEHLKGYGLEGRAAPKSAIKSAFHIPVRPVRPAFDIRYSGDSFARGGGRR